MSPAKPAKSKAKSPAPKTAVAALRKLEAALGLPDVAQQCLALGNPDTATARAALAHTRKGTPVARAYLAVLATGDADAALAVVRHCAAMERGRKAMLGAFLSAWRLVPDARAIEAAYQNLARGIVDEPRLLEAAVHTARQLGLVRLDHRLARLERATRLAPLVKQLAGPAPGRTLAAKQLATLDPLDRGHVNARILDEPGKFDRQLAVAAVIALADDPAINDMTLSGAILDMRYHGQDELIAAWQPRVAAGDELLRTRLLGLFEWTSLWATDDSELAPYIRALLPAGGHPDVFAHIEHAMASDNAIVRAAICEHWLADPRAFGDAQIDKLMRSAVAIAEGHDDAADRRAADRALARGGHIAARQALFDALRNAHPRIRPHVYNGLAQIEHPDIVPFLIERLFVEREAYGPLVAALAARFDAVLHRRVIDTLDARAADPGAVHAATLYADLLAERSPRLVVQLARGLLAWQARANDDGRRLRHVFEQATAAALAVRSLDDARAFLTRARELPNNPYSDYHVKHRDAKTPSPLADAAFKKQIAALEAGKLDREIADARAAADAARAARTPLPADDARLATLGGCTVARRLLDDRERSVVWFFDEVGDLHVYDGYAVLPMVLEVAGVGGATLAADGMAAFLEGRTAIDERVTLVGDRAVREVIRIGNRVLVFDGGDVVGLKFAQYVAARDAVARFAANPGGLRRVDPWSVRRAYGTAWLAVVGATVEGTVDDLERVHATPEAAVAAVQKWEGRRLAAGGRITRLWVERAATPRDDRLLATYLAVRAKSGTLHALTAIMTAIDDAGLALLAPDLRVELGPPASDAELADLPAPLVELWREAGRATFGAVRLVSPREYRERPRRKVIATIDGKPLIELGRKTAKAIATALATELLHQLERRLLDVFRLRVGERPGPATRRVRLAKAAQTWEAIVDGNQLVTRSVGVRLGKPKLVTHATANAAAEAFDAAVAAARAKGYR